MYVDVKKLGNTPTRNGQVEPGKRAC